MRSRTRLVVAAAVCTVALVGGGGPVGAASPVAVVRAPAGYSTTKIKAAGLALALPKRWLRLDPKSRNIDQMLAKVSAKNPKLSNLLDQFAQVRDQILFWGIDAGSTTFASNVIVSAAGLDKSVVDHPDEARAAFGSAVGKTVNGLDVQPAKVAGVKSLRLTYQLPVTSLTGTPVTDYGTILIVPTKRGTMEVTYSSNQPSDSDTTLPVVIKAMRLL